MRRMTATGRSFDRPVPAGPELQCTLGAHPFVIMSGYRSG